MCVCVCVCMCRESSKIILQISKGTAEVWKSTLKPYMTLEIFRRRYVIGSVMRDLMLSQEFC